MRMVKADLIEALDHHNVYAFLRVIRAGETNQSPEAYRMMVGGKLFDAPPWKHPKKLNRITFPNGSSVYSTAAGAYQFIAKTWDEMAMLYGLEDFSPDNQDIAAVGLIVRRNALLCVREGKFHEAIRRCAKEWASLPGSPYNQPTKSLAKTLEVYVAHGGRLEETSQA